MSEALDAAIEWNAKRISFELDRGVLLITAVRAQRRKSTLGRKSWRRVYDLLRRWYPIK